LAVTLLLSSVAGCAAGGKTAGAGSGAKGTGPKGAVTDADKFAKYNPPIKVSTVKRVRPNDVYPEGKDVYNNPYIDALKNELGIELEYLWMVDTSQAEAKYATMMASKEFPDLWWAFNKDFINLAYNDAIMDITNVYETWASDDIKSYCMNFKEGFDSAYINGKLYGMPALGQGIIGPQELTWIRNDWLGKTGKSIPKTLDELWDTMVAFKDLKEGNYGFSLNKDLTAHWGFGPTVIMNAYGAFHRIWIWKDKKIVYGGVQPEMKEALKYLQRMYAEGLIHPEFAVMDGGACATDIAAGKVGVYAGPNWSGWYPLVDSVINEGADWIPIINPTPDGNLGYIQQLWPINEVSVVNKNSKHPEVTFRMINVFDKWTQEGKFNSLIEEGYNLWRIFPVDFSNPKKEYGMAIKTMEAYETGDTTGFTPEELAYHDQGVGWLSGDPAGFGRYIQLKAFKHLFTYGDANKIIMSEPKGADPEYFSSIKSTLEQLEIEAYVKIIMGAPLSDFDDFVAKWNQAGGEKATEEVNEVYNRKQ